MEAAAAKGMRAQEDLAEWPCVLPLLVLGEKERQALVEMEGLRQAGETQAPTLEGLQLVREMPAPVSADPGWPAELPALTGPDQIFAAALVSLRELRAQVDPTTKPHE